VSRPALKPVRVKTLQARDAETVLDLLRASVRCAKTDRPYAMLSILLEPNGSFRFIHHYGDRMALHRLVGAVEEWKATTFAKRPAVCEEAPEDSS